MSPRKKDLRLKKLAVLLSVVLIITSTSPREVEASWFSNLMGGLFTIITAPIWVFCQDNPTFRKNNPFRKKVWEEDDDRFKEKEREKEKEEEEKKRLTPIVTTHKVKVYKYEGADQLTKMYEEQQQEIDELRGLLANKTKSLQEAIDLEEDRHAKAIEALQNDNRNAKAIEALQNTNRNVNTTIGKMEKSIMSLDKWSNTMTESFNNLRDYTENLGTKIGEMPPKREEEKGPWFWRTLPVIGTAAVLYTSKLAENFGKGIVARWGEKDQTRRETYVMLGWALVSVLTSVYITVPVVTSIFSWGWTLCLWGWNLVGK